MTESNFIRVRGAREHNLRGVDVDVPKNALVVFTGVSGSGKSSLAFDTLFAEGQRRFVESLSAYARQFLGQLERPAVDAVEGISPTLSIDQKTVNRNPRSTVGTVTEIADHLRLLFARLGQPHCTLCGREVSALTLDAIIDDVLRVGQGERVQVLAPIVQARKGEYRKELDALRRDGWARARIDGEVRSLSDPIQLARYEKHTLEVVVDRLVPNLADRARLAEAIESASELAGGVVVVLIGETERTYATARACPDHPSVSLPELEPRLFSFNAPQGACSTCLGLGYLEGFSLEALLDLREPLPRAFKALNDSGKLPFSHIDVEVLQAITPSLGGRWSDRLDAWPEPALDRLLHGAPGLVYRTHKARASGATEEREWLWSGLLPALERVWRFTSYKGFIPFRERVPCGECGGARLNAVARAVTFRGRSLPEVIHLTVAEAHELFAGLELAGEEREIGAALIQEIVDRLTFLDEVGLGYLSLDRSAATLSGGEAQRIRLAAQVGSALQGVTYVLDEPSIGLHPRDNQRLLRTLRRLRDRGNTVLVVEHDEETMLAADHVIDIGPAAGRGGGELVYSGPPDGLLACARSLTGAYLRRDRRIPVPELRRGGSGEVLAIRGGCAHNLKDLDVDLPLGTLTAITGVSGSGKSTLVFEVLRKTLKARAQGDPQAVRGCREVRGDEEIEKVVRIGQQPIGRTPRSNPATYTKAFDLIRDLFARTPESRARGYKKGRFSFNVKGGRCEACTGAGVRTVEMQLLPDVQVPCEVCGGRRFNTETLEITFKGLTIHDVLQLTCAEALDRFSKVPKLRRILQTLVDVGLGYLPLGQPSTTLSGGEAQRVKLASELHRPATGRTLFLLDEPTTGLHAHDVAALLAALHRLVDQGNTVVVVEHHTALIWAADHVIDLGPEGGDGGGTCVGAGTPEHLATLATPTGRALAALASPEVPLAAESPPTPLRGPAGPGALVVRGARLHNLQAIDVDIPHRAMTVITGVSGSGKTSLAFDTLFAEGQRRYVESLSTYARRFLGRVDRAPVERIEGLEPAIAIDQKSASHNPRSTVATVTEIHDVLRVLWARIGQPHCPTCGVAVVARSPSTSAHELAATIAGPGWLVAGLRPVEHGEERRKGLRREGWTRLLTKLHPPQELALTAPEAAEALSKGAWLVVDRLDPSKTSGERLSEAIQQAFALGGGVATFLPRAGGEPVRLTERATCPEHGVVLPEALTPRHFSFNARIGACAACEGLGVVRQISRRRLFPSPAQPFWEAMDPRVRATLSRSTRTRALIGEVLAVLGAKGPMRDATEAQWRGIMEGLPHPIGVRWSKQRARGSRTVEEERDWEGLRALLASWNSSLDWLTDEERCSACQGARLKPALRGVTVDGETLHAFTARPVEAALERVRSWALVGEQAVIAARAREDLLRRLRFLDEVGLGYLTLDRAASTLSGGESQRIRLASQLGSQLTGVIYVLDEPTVGLHPRDTERLLGTLEGLRDLGNTVVVVEHDPDTIRRADHVIDLGPGAGRQGGRVLAAGTPAALEADPRSLTGRWLCGALRIPERSTRRVGRGRLELRGARANNLHGESIWLPLGAWTAVSGVSGSGKSSLILDSLVPAVSAVLGRDPEGGSEGLHLTERIDKLVVVDQQPIGRSPRSTPATYVKAFDGIRKLFAQTRGAQERGWKAGRFSFNSPGGRCGQCEGRGQLLVEMHFMPDVWTECPSCKGKRFNRETLAVRWKGHTIADVLAMRADEALRVFTAHRTIARRLRPVVEVGLGYLTLGQAATTLSGGEAQRLKLASELGTRRGHVLYVLDEPTTGLHLADVSQLVGVLHALADRGQTVITVEHHLDVLRQADHLIDLGPEGGARGGRIVGMGPPEHLATLDTPTGRALRG
ncbi:MAG: excinuclease ABC subunit UvrA [Deltaproteobacteria bacterium]|nr:MAG: excinuclease ABC subunit UvrA [Deltaproteobacteria bacterium]